MLDEIAPKVVVVSKSDNDEFQLTVRERALLQNFRAMRESAKVMIVDLSEQYRRTLPAAATKLLLVGASEKV